MKINLSLLVSAGEPSGDLIGAQFISAAKQLESDTLFFGMGGPAMQAAGCEIIRPLPSVMGFGGPLRNIKNLASTMMYLALEARRKKADAAILLDFPDFHMLLARALKRSGIPVFQFVSPQIWAWRPGRIRAIKRLYERTFLIFPFEKKIYDQAGAPSDFLGHPAADRLAGFESKAIARKRLGLPEKGTVVALLPGSRKTVFKRNSPVFLESASLLAQSRPDTTFLLSVPQGVEVAPEGKYRDPSGNVNIRRRPPRFLASPEPGPLLLRASDAAIVSSGTGALESVILGVPFAGVYVTSPFTYRLVKMLAAVNHVLMANILAGREVVKEFLQEGARPEAISAEILELLENGPRRQKMLEEFAAISSTLGPFGAAGRAARSVIDFCVSKG
jgi:lipid-A-disaccharide synthase